MPVLTHLFPVYKWKLSSHSLGSLQGIDLPVSAFGLYLQMGGHVAVPHTPLGSGIREDEAVSAGGKFLGPHAAFTLLNYCMARAAIKLTACLAHKRAANTRFYDCTVHFNHVLSSFFQRLLYLQSLKNFNLIVSSISISLSRKIDTIIHFSSRKCRTYRLAITTVRIRAIRNPHLHKHLRTDDSFLIPQLSGFPAFIIFLVVNTQVDRLKVER